jgi:hypothetical protein
MALELNGPRNSRKAGRSAGFSPSRRRDQTFKRAVVQGDRIAHAFGGKAQHAACQFVRFHRGIADRFERQPRLVKRRLEQDKRLGIEGTIMEPAHGSVLTALLTTCLLSDPRTFGAKFAGFVAHSYHSNQQQLTAKQIAHDIRVTIAGRRVDSELSA